MTVTRLIAIACTSGTSRTMLRKGTRKIPPPSPSNAPKPPAAIPARKVNRTII
jgi:hypothetical protein